jgi:hypothetical protein
LLIPYLGEPSHYHKAVIGDPKRLTHQKLNDFYFSTNLTPQILVLTNLYEDTYPRGGNGFF